MRRTLERRPTRHPIHLLSRLLAIHIYSDHSKGSPDVYANKSSEASLPLRELRVRRSDFPTVVSEVFSH